MAVAGTLTLAYDANTRTFTATVTAYPSFTCVNVQLTAPNPPGGSYAMSSANPTAYPSYWTHTFPPPPAPNPVQPGQVWTAVAILQGTGTATGAVTT